MHILTGACIVTEISLALLDLVDDHRTVNTRIGSNLTQRLLNGLGHNMNTSSLIVILTLQTLKSLGSTDIRHSASGQIALLDSSAGSIQRILNPILLLLHLNLSGGTHIKHSHTA